MPRPLPLNTHTILLGILVFGLAAIIIPSLSKLTFQNDGTIYARNQRASLQPGDPVIQSFRARENGLSEVRVPIKNLTGYPSEKIRLELLDRTCVTIIHAQDFGYLSFTFHTTSPNLRFAPIIDSANKDYCLRVTYFTKEKRKGEVPYLAASSDDVFSDSSYTNMKDGRVYDGRSIAFQLAYSSDTASKNIQTLIDRMSQYKPWFFKGGWLIAIFSTFLFSTLALFWRLIKLRA